MVIDRQDLAGGLLSHHRSIAGLREVTSSLARIVLPLTVRLAGRILATGAGVLQLLRLARTRLDRMLSL